MQVNFYFRQYSDVKSAYSKLLQDKMNEGWIAKEVTHKGFTDYVTITFNKA